jgi:hypothetical protein
VTPALRSSSAATAGQCAVCSLQRAASIARQGYVMQQVMRQGCCAGSNLTTSPSPSRRKNTHKEQASTFLRRLTTSKRQRPVQYSTETHRTTRAEPPALLGTAAQSPTQLPVHAAVSRSIPSSVAQGSRRWTLYLKPVLTA